MDTIAGKEVWKKSQKVTLIETRCLTHIHLLRDTKVRYFHPTFVVDQNIRAFDITVDDITFMEIAQSLQNLTYEILHQGLFKSAIAAQKSSNRTARNVLQKDIEAIVFKRGIYQSLSIVFTNEGKD